MAAWNRASDGNGLSVEHLIVEPEQASGHAVILHQVLGRPRGTTRERPRVVISNDDALGAAESVQVSRSQAGDPRP